MALRLGAIHDLVKRVKKLDQDKLLKQVLSNTGLQQDILELNFEDQLYERGVTADGKTLGEYTPYSKQLKLSGDGDHRVDHITLKDTGEFYSTRKFKNDSDGFSIYANTLKPDHDLLTFGKILGLDEKSKATAREWILPMFTNQLKAEIWK